MTWDYQLDFEEAAELSKRHRFVVDDLTSRSSSMPSADTANLGDGATWILQAMSSVADIAGKITALNACTAARLTDAIDAAGDADDAVRRWFETLEGRVP
ncbi:MAG: hypothetical protein ACK5Q5_24995 [Planctomycetaceae bacterium]